MIMESLMYLVSSHVVSKVEWGTVRVVVTRFGESES